MRLQPPPPNVNRLIYRLLPNYYITDISNTLIIPLGSKHIVIMYHTYGMCTNWTFMTEETRGTWMAYFEGHEMKSVLRKTSIPIINCSQGLTVKDRQKAENFVLFHVQIRFDYV